MSAAEALMDLGASLSLAPDQVETVLLNENATRGQRVNLV